MKFNDIPVLNFCQSEDFILKTLPICLLEGRWSLNILSLLTATI